MGQDFFPDPLQPPEFGAAGPATAPPTGFALGAPIGGAAMGPLTTGLLGLGLAVGLAAAAGSGGDDDGGGGGGGDDGTGWGGSVLNGCTNANPGRAAFETSEYYASHGLGIICAAERYATVEDSGAPGFGAGVTAAIFDDGFYTYHPDLRDNFDAMPFGDGYTEFGDGEPEDYPDFIRDGNHGTHVAGIIGASRNGTGMHGVAPQVTLVGYRGLTNYADPREEFVGVQGEDPFNLILADGIDWALSRGAEVMNHSWGFRNASGESLTLLDRGSYSAVAEYLGQTAMTAFETSVSSGMVHVFSAGNSGLSQPTVFAGLPYYGEEFGLFDDQIVAIVSVDPDGRISDFSNRCGVAADHCLAAPGSYILSTVARTDDDTPEYETYEEYSGTSMAAPQVTGAIALLLSEHQELTAAQALAILKDTATDLGEAGVDEVYGHGLLNLENAVKPQGMLSVQLAGTLGVDARPVAGSGVRATGGMGRALGAALAPQRLMVTDRYNRGFTLSTADFVTEADTTGLAADRALAFATSQTRVLALADSASQLRFSPYGSEALARPGMLGDVHAPQTAIVTGGAALAWSAALADGLTGTVELAGPLGAGNAGATDGRYLGGRLDLGLGGRAQLSLGAGLMQESGGFLGTDLSGAFGERVEAETAFVSLGAGLALGAGQLSVSYTEGVTDFAGDGVVRAGRDIGSRSLGLSWELADAGLRGARLGLGVRRMLDVTGGALDMNVPVARTAAQGGAATQGVVLSDVSIGLEEAAAPTDLELRYNLPAGPGQLGVALTQRIDDVAGDSLVAGIGFSMMF